MFATGLTGCQSTGDTADAGAAADSDGGNGTASGADGGGTGNGSGASDDCAPACGKLAPCNLCVADAAGHCMDVATCTSTCQSDTASQTIATCVVGAADCPAISTCLNSGGNTVAPCAQACIQLKRRRRPSVL